MTVSSSPDALHPHLESKTWKWRGFPINYTTSSAPSTQTEALPVMVMVHGFGASSGHWRKNLPILGETYRCYAIDLIGFGASAKPTPGIEIEYTFETWGQQVADFCREVAGQPAFLVGNSIGCIVILQTAVDFPELVLGVGLINCSLRLLHDRKRATLPWYKQMGTPIVQSLLSMKWLGKLFFERLAQPQVVRKILLQAYHRTEAVTDELVDMIMKPARDRGAVDVFFAFTRYSGGPLAEDLLPQLSCPAIILWGTEDPWEPVELGQELGKFPTVTKFIPLEGLGHCPQDEGPEIVNPILGEWGMEQQSLM